MFGHLIQPLDRFKARSAERRPLGRPRHAERNYISNVAVEHLGLHHEELEDMAREKDTWAPLISPLSS